MNNFLEQNVSLEKCPALVLNADYRPLSYYPLSLWSWQDTVKWFSRVPLDPLKEPRIKDPQVVIPVTAQHPFFWAGYMVIDTQRTKPVVAAGAANP